MNILVIDVGGTHVKILASRESERREIESGRTMTAQQMVSSVAKLADGWKYEVVSIGYPGPVVDHRPTAEPYNLGSGWIGFDFAAAFGRPATPRCGRSTATMHGFSIPIARKRTGASAS